MNFCLPNKEAAFATNKQTNPRRLEVSAEFRKVTQGYCSL